MGTNVDYMDSSGLPFPNQVLTKGLITCTWQTRTIHVINIGSHFTIEYLKSPRFLHKSIYNTLLLSCFDLFCEALNDFAFPDVFYFVNAGVTSEIGDNFDVMPSQDFSEAMGNLISHYQVDRRNSI